MLEISGAKDDPKLCPVQVRPALERLKSIEHDLAADPADAHLRIEHARWLYSLGRDLQAAEAAGAAADSGALTAEDAAYAVSVLEVAGQRGRALELANRYLQMYADAACLLLARGDVRSDEGDYDGAQADYALAGRNPGSAELADIATAAMLRRMGRLADASDVLQKWKSSSIPDTVLERARLAKARCVPAQSLVGMLTPLVNDDGQKEEAVSLLSAALRMDRRFDECRTLLERTSSGRAAHAAAVERGWLAYDEDADYDQAEREFHRVPQCSAYWSAAVRGLSSVMLAKGEISKAARLVQRAIQCREGDVELLQQRAWIAVDSGRHHDGAAEFAALVAKDRHNVTSRASHARVLMAANRFEDARDVLREADIQQDDPILTIERGWLAYYTSRYAEAESRFRGLLGSGACPIEAVWGLSAVLRARGRPLEAGRLIKRALRAHTHDPSLRREEGWVAYDRGRYDRAAEIFGLLVKRDRYNNTDRRWQVASLRMAKKYARARHVLDDRPRTRRNDPGLEIECGWIAYAMGDDEDAASHFRQARAHGGQPDLYVPALVKVLLRMNQADAAEREAAAVQLTPSIATARADVQVHKGFPADAIAVLRKFETQLHEDGLGQLVALLHGVERDDDARGVFEKWLGERSYENKNAVESASPAIVGTWIELAGWPSKAQAGELRSRVESARNFYAGPDPVPVAVARSAISTMRKLDKDRARIIAEESVARHPASVDLLIEAAIASFSRHDYQSALNEFDRVIGMEPDNDRAIQWRCRSMRRLGQWSQLEEYLEQKTRHLQRSARLRIQLGWFRLAQDDYRQADDAFAEAFRLDRNSEQALFGRVTALRKMQRWPDASNVIEGCWKQHRPDSSRRKLAKAMLALDREDFATAADLFQKVDGVPGMLGQASVLMQQRREGEAREKLNDAVGEDGDRPGPKIALATLLAQSNEDDIRRTEDRRRADELCRAAMGWGAESDAAALGCRAELALGEGRLRAAEALLEDARDRDPYGSHTAALAGVLIGMHRVDEAVTMLRERLKEYRRDCSAQFQLYRALRARRDGTAALAALRNAFGLATGPASDALAVGLAYELEEQGRSAEAEELLRARLAGRGGAGDDQLHLGLAWLLLNRGERAHSPALLEEAVAEASQVLTHPDPPSVTVDPEQVTGEALKCRGTAYYKLAEHERNPGERIRLATLARRDQGRQRRNSKEKAPRGSRWAVLLAVGLDTGFRVLTLLVALTFTIVLWILHDRNQTAWSTATVVSLTPVFLAIVLLAALLPQLQTLKLAGLEAQTRERPDVPLPTSLSVALPQVTEFAVAAHENFLDAVHVSDLVGTSNTPQPTAPASTCGRQSLSAPGWARRPHPPPPPVLHKPGHDNRGPSANRSLVHVVPPRAADDHLLADRHGVWCLVPAVPPQGR